ncbi:3-oxoacyl-ACP synthase [Marinifilum breve]|uniref:3-oxoacyl-ACP synthase n=1 Tax=Marinifilum breve TaxID=2184082 RepID=A0A2V4A5E8_9BACT|nr:3-oxoacyl-ACP synthase [Marinifilum breve]PXY02600.1 3-oxoacyl-ACP synthase [Marinifilum breve]
MNTSNTLKVDLYNKAQELIQSKIEANNESLSVLKESVASETKSTAGDKHETGRAMMHLEQEKVMRQLTNNQKLKSIIDRVNPEIVNETVQLGSLVITNSISFYVLAGLGQMELNGQNYFVVSFQSDLVQALKGKRKGDSLTFKGQDYTIKEIL